MVLFDDGTNDGLHILSVQSNCEVIPENLVGNIYVVVWYGISVCMRLLEQYEAIDGYNINQMKEHRFLPFRAITRVAFF